MQLEFIDKDDIIFHDGQFYIQARVKEVKKVGDKVYINISDKGILLISQSPFSRKQENVVKNDKTSFVVGLSDYEKALDNYDKVREIFGSIIGKDIK